MSEEITMFSEPLEFIPNSRQPLNDGPETVEFATATVEPLPTPEPVFQSVSTLPRSRSPSTDHAAVVVVIVVDETFVGDEDDT